MIGMISCPTMKSAPIYDSAANERKFFTMRLTTCRGECFCDIGRSFPLVDLKLSRMTNPEDCMHVFVSEI